VRRPPPEPRRLESTGVAEGLAAAAAAFAPAVRPPVDGLVYGPLVARLNGGTSPGLELAVEQVYEGYLAHYRTSRLLPASAGQQVLLLAGDFFYAHGLQSISATGDIGAVGLLTRLMGACSVLRAGMASLSIDDALWETAVAAVASGEGHAARAAARAAFTAVEAAMRRQDAAEIAAAAEQGLRSVRDAVDGRCPSKPSMAAGRRQPASAPEGE
jgi:hypothetical protein